jgi:hypothetical protein
MNESQVYEVTDPPGAGSPQPSLQPRACATALLPDDPASPDDPDELDEPDEPDEPDERDDEAPPEEEEEVLLDVDPVLPEELLALEDELARPEELLLPPEAPDELVGPDEPLLDPDAPAAPDELVGPVGPEELLLGSVELVLEDALVPPAPPLLDEVLVVDEALGPVPLLLDAPGGVDTVLLRPVAPAPAVPVVTVLVPEPPLHARTSTSADALHPTTTGDR